MILYIDTTPDNFITLGLKAKNKFISKKQISSQRQQAEKLLPGVAKLLQANRKKLSDLTAIEVADQRGSFTSLRIGVVSANALAYALRIPVTGEYSRKIKSKSGILSLNLVKPEYGCEPEIVLKDKKTGHCGKAVKN